MSHGKDDELSGCAREEKNEYFEPCFVVFARIGHSGGWEFGAGKTKINY